MNAPIRPVSDLVDGWLCKQAAEIARLTRERDEARAEGADLRDLRAQHAEWSQSQFGPVSAIGPAKHLSKEALEVAAEPHNAVAHAYCWMLLWDMQRRAGISDDTLADAIRHKLQTNKARGWARKGLLPRPVKIGVSSRWKWADVERRVTPNSNDEIYDPILRASRGSRTKA